MVVFGVIVIVKNIHKSFDPFERAIIGILTLNEVVSPRSMNAFCVAVQFKHEPRHVLQLLRNTKLEGKQMDITSFRRRFTLDFGI